MHSVQKEQRSYAMIQIIAMSAEIIEDLKFTEELRGGKGGCGSGQWEVMQILRCAPSHHAACAPPTCAVADATAGVAAAELATITIVLICENDAEEERLLHGFGQLGGH